MRGATSADAGVCPVAFPTATDILCRIPDAPGISRLARVLLFSTIPYSDADVWGNLISMLVSTGLNLLNAINSLELLLLFHRDSIQLVVLDRMIRRRGEQQSVSPQLGKDKHQLAANSSDTSGQLMSTIVFPRQLP